VLLPLLPLLLLRLLLLLLQLLLLLVLRHGWLGMPPVRCVLALLQSCRLPSAAPA
jgi:predicted carbohydrate-binding protein with CBM5 and CBM33 domain